MSNSANLMSSCLLKQQFTEKVDEYPLTGVVKYCLRTIGTTKTVRYTE